MGLSELAKVVAKLFFGVAVDDVQTLCGAVLTHERTRSSLRHPELLLE